MAKTNMEGKKLYEELDKEFGKRGLDQIEIPAYIKENLSRDLRVYQEEAIKYYFANLASFKKNHLMFNMATGSGKTLMMAALMLDCYKRGYRDFIFFVNRSQIMEKTKANFIDKTSSKYLFKEKIIIDSKIVEINAITNFNETKEDCINIYFTTIQSLHSLLTRERENAITLQDLAERKLVLLADEAHHLNSDTKKLGEKELEEKESWESITRKAYENHNENLMLEFTATIPNHRNVIEKYQDKIIYKYDLKEFCKEGYSKRIFVMKYENREIKERFLGAILLSLYRELLAQKYNIALKPVILFKSENINPSKENQKNFLEFLENLNSSIIENFYENINSKENDLFAKSLEFFKREFKETYLENITSYIKDNFKANYVINVNEDKDLEKNQILLNSLEDKENQIRVIFAVNKLNEGWDVLNLFDIVRLGGKSNGSATTQEVQLIGRGARYYPFYIKDSNPELFYKRKFDSDLENDLNILEKLSYHTLNDVEFIKNLNQNMREQGIIDETQIRIELTANKALKNLVKENKIYYAKNRRIKKQDLEHFIITRDEMEQKIKDLKIPLYSSKIEETEEKFEELKVQEDSYSFKKLGNLIGEKYFLKAMNILNLSFKELNKNFDFDSKTSFIEDYLGKIELCFSKKQIFNPGNNLEIAKFILKNFKEIKEKIRQEYEITDFEAHLFNFKNRVIFTQREVKQKGYEWLYYNQCCFDSNLEENFLDFIDRSKEKIDGYFSQWFIIRNDGFEEFKLYDNRKNELTYGQGFEPDFIFFGKRKNEKKDFLSVECFMEVKGSHLVETDGWKEKFLETITGTKINASLDHNFSLFGFPFFRSNKTADNQKFIEIFNDFLESKIP